MPCVTNVRQQQPKLRFISIFAGGLHSCAVRHAKIGALAHLARALDWQSKGARFESDMLHIESGCIAAFLLLPAQEKMPFSARNCYGVPSAQDLGHFPARQAGGIPFRAGKDAFFCLELPRSTFCAGFGAFSCPAGGSSATGGRYSALCGDGFDAKRE